jgi:alpha-L-arabinofuranosidase
MLLNKLARSIASVGFYIGMLQAAAALAADGGYLFVTFKGEQTPMTEQIYFASSEDGRKWTALNGGQPVLVSNIGEKGVRDPYLLRAHDGKTFFLLATDLSINLNRDWGRAQNAGSQSIVIWESSDLTHWSTPRLAKVAAPDAGCTWAPEAVYDELTGDYLVFWASKTRGDNFAKQRIWAARTRDFQTFSKPFIYIDKAGHVIDTDIVREGSNYYRFSKDEQFKAITMEVSDQLMGPWQDVTNFSLAKLQGYEGPECYQLKPATDGKPATWCLLLDYYSKGEGYKPFLTAELSKGQFAAGESFDFPFRFRHGSILPVRAAEFDRLQVAFGSPGQAPAGAGVSPDRSQPITLTVRSDQQGTPISPDLLGIFFEDLSWAADGGLYAELVRNRSFEFSANDHSGWNELTGWDFVEQDGGKGSVIIKSDSPLNANNTHYAVLGLQKDGMVGIRNSGFDGIPVKAGEKYNFSVFARQLAGPGGALVIRLETKDGGLLSETKLPPPASAWAKYQAVLEPTSTVADARLVLLTAGVGQVGVDMISLFPQKTFRDHPNGLRADLAQAIADLHPRFMRFPGGCLVHGDGLDNIYNWKNSIGPVEERKGQRNIWNYNQSLGLGYFEYFQFCEDIGAKPLPVVAAGVCCQNSGATVTKVWEQGQRGLAMADMPPYIQDVLDLIEWANGPATSTWGAKRAAAGHPAPFHLQYLGIGNEDKQTDVFRERFKMIYDAVKAKHPEITIIGTVGPRPNDDDYRQGWNFAKEIGLPMVDEHYYEAPEWFWNNLHRYDTYDRSKSKVYVGEYASRGNALLNALAEAAYLTSLERNSDVVHLASYAPLLCKQGHVSWQPDLIYFDNARITASANYYVQQLFSVNSGDTYLPIQGATNAAQFAASAVRDSKSGDLVLKIVNGQSTARPMRIELTAPPTLPAQATRTLLAGPDAKAVNEPGKAPAVLPRTDSIAIAAAFDYEAPANSLSILRIQPRSTR